MINVSSSASFTYFLCTGGRAKVYHKHSTKYQLAVVFNLAPLIT